MHAVGQFHSECPYCNLQLVYVDNIYQYMFKTNVENALFEIAINLLIANPLSMPLGALPMLNWAICQIRND